MKNAKKDIPEKSNKDKYKRNADKYKRNEDINQGKSAKDDSKGSGITGGYLQGQSPVLLSKVHKSLQR